MLSEYISLMFTIGRQRYALSSIYSNRQPMTTHKPRWVQPACRDACHSLGMLRKPLIRKPRPKKLRKFMQAAKTVLLHALFWLSLAGPLKVNPLSGTIIRNVNLGERGCLVEHKRSLKKEIHWMERDTVNIFTFCTRRKKKNQINNFTTAKLLCIFITSTTCKREHRNAPLCKLDSAERETPVGKAHERWVGRLRSLFPFQIAQQKSHIEYPCSEK